MSQETVTYLTNIIIVAILAGLMTHSWLRQVRSSAMRYWMLAAWVMLAADALFAARPVLPHSMGRILPTLLVTVGQVGLLWGAQATAGRPIRPAVALVSMATHAAGLILFLQVESIAEWRKVFNGLIWMALSIASYLSLRHAPAVFWRPLIAPATVFLLHGLFHGLRLGLGALFATRQWDEASAWLQILGDLEVSFFMVALFVGVLVANLQLRNEELSTALAEVQTLSGLLPICAWCKKVRNDEGYWQKVEDYLAAHSQITFTHGICADCYKEHDPNRIAKSR